MDQELKEYLDGFETRFLTRVEGSMNGLETRIMTRVEGSMDALETRIMTRVEGLMDASFTRWSQHILYEMGARFNEVNNRLESMDSRLKLQAGLIQSGARAMARFSEFAESSEQRWVALVTRVEALERKVNGTGHE